MGETYYEIQELKEQFPSISSVIRPYRYSSGELSAVIVVVDQTMMKKNLFDKQRVREILTSLRFSEDKIKNDFPENTQFAKGANAAIQAALENLGLVSEICPRCKNEFVPLSGMTSSKQKYKTQMCDLCRATNKTSTGY